MTLQNNSQQDNKTPKNSQEIPEQVNEVNSQSEGGISEYVLQLPGTSVEIINEKSAVTEASNSECVIVDQFVPGQKKCAVIFKDKNPKNVEVYVIDGANEGTCESLQNQSLLGRLYEDSLNGLSQFDAFTEVVVDQTAHVTSQTGQSQESSCSSELQCGQRTPLQSTQSTQSSNAPEEPKFRPPTQCLSSNNKDHRPTESLGSLNCFGVLFDTNVDNLSFDISDMIQSRLTEQKSDGVVEENLPLQKTQCDEINVDGSTSMVHVCLNKSFDAERVTCNAFFVHDKKNPVKSSNINDETETEGM